MDKDAAAVVEVVVVEVERGAEAYPEAEAEREAEREAEPEAAGDGEADFGAAVPGVGT